MVLANDIFEGTYRGCANNCRIFSFGAIMGICTHDPHNIARDNYSILGCQQCGEITTNQQVWILTCAFASLRAILHIFWGG